MMNSSPLRVKSPWKNQRKAVTNVLPKKTTLATSASVKAQRRRTRRLNSQSYLNAYQRLRKSY